MFHKKFSRKDFLQKVALPVTAGAAFAPLISCGKKDFSKDSSKPNIIVITADDLGWKDLSCYGNGNIKTKNIDRIARQGVKFENAFVVSSSCAPSRASLITGQYPHTNGVTGLTHIYKTRSLSPLHTTLPGLLRDAGYNTALQGKWHVSPYLPTSWYGYNERLSGLFPKDWKITTSKTAVDFIQRNRDNRFYLEINYMQNHRDAYGEFHYAKGHPVNPDRIRVPEYYTLPNRAEIRKDLSKFYSQTLDMDAQIGEIMKALDDMKLTENTIVLFMSDNGPPYPGNKMTLYDRGTGTPLIVRWPQSIKGGRKIKSLINTIDIMPSLLEAAGISIPGAVEGKSFLPLMKGTSKKPLHEAVYTEMTNHVHYIPTRAVRTKRWKYIRNYSDIAFGLDQNNHDKWAHRLCELKNQPWKKPRVREELYDLSVDPHEQKNLAGDAGSQKQLRLMRGLLKGHQKKTKDPFLNGGFTKDYNKEDYKPSKAGEKYK